MFASYIFIEKKKKPFGRAASFAAIRVRYTSHKKVRVVLTDYTGARQRPTNYVSPPAQKYRKNSPYIISSRRD